MQAIQQGQLWRMRCGQVVRILTTDAPSTIEMPIVGMSVDDGMLYRFTEDGRNSVAGRELPYDLTAPFVPPLEAEGYAIVTQGDEAFSPANSLIVYGDLAGAEAGCLPTQGERVIKVRVTEVRDGE